MLRRIFGPKWQVIAGRQRKLNTEKLHNLYFSPDIRILKRWDKKRCGLDLYKCGIQSVINSIQTISVCPCGDNYPENLLLNQECFPTTYILFPLFTWGRVGGGGNEKKCVPAKNRPMGHVTKVLPTVSTFFVINPSISRRYYLWKKKWDNEAGESEMVEGCKTWRP